METDRKWKYIVKISQQGGDKKLNNGYFKLLFTFLFMFSYLLTFASVLFLSVKKLMVFLYING